MIWECKQFNSNQTDLQLHSNWHCFHCIQLWLTLQPANPAFTYLDYTYIYIFFHWCPQFSNWHWETFIYFNFFYSLLRSTRPASLFFHTWFADSVLAFLVSISTYVMCFSIHLSWVLLDCLFVVFDFSDLCHQCSLQWFFSNLKQLLHYSLLVIWSGRQKGSRGCSSWILTESGPHCVERELRHRIAL